MYHLVNSVKIISKEKFYGTLEFFNLNKPLPLVPRRDIEVIKTTKGLFQFIFKFSIFSIFQAQFCRAYGRERRAVRQVPQVLLPLGSVLLDEGVRQEM